MKSRSAILRIVTPSCPRSILSEFAVIVFKKVQVYKHLLGDYSMICEVLSMSFGVRQIHVQIPVLSFTSCITLGNQFKFSEPHLLIYKLWIIKCLISWYSGEDGIIWFFNPHGKWLIPCFSLMCVNWIDSICKILRLFISKKKKKRNNQGASWSLNKHTLCLILFPSIIRLWSQLVLGVKNSTVQLKNSGRWT